MKRLITLTMLAAALASSVAAQEPPAAPAAPAAPKAVAAPAASAPDGSVDALLKVLVKKGMLSEDEAKSVRVEQKAATPTTPSVPAVAPIPAIPPIPNPSANHTGEVNIVNHDYVVEQGTIVDGNARVVRGDLEVRGEVNGDASTTLGDVSVNGHVRGNVTAVRGDVSLGPTAVVDGDVQVVGGDLYQEAGSVVHGKIRNTEEPRVSFPGRVEGGRNFVREAVMNGPFNLPLAFTLLIVGIVLLAAAPQRMDLVGKTFVNRPVYSFMVGIASVPAMAVAAVLSIVTIVGPALVAAAYVGAFMMGVAAMALMLGRRVAVGKTYRSRFYPLTVGLLVWLFATAVSRVSNPLSGLMTAATVLAYIIAIGAALSTGFGASPFWLRDRFSRRAGAFSYVDPTNTYAGKTHL
ncbi:MAG TPA: hypothetical protein VGM37_07400 [Armatimonadota bacterium]|jgi:cytoskeletal protein CcmA (bactofilin family)